MTLYCCWSHSHHCRRSADIIESAEMALPLDGINAQLRLLHYVTRVVVATSLHIYDNGDGRLRRHIVMLMPRHVV